ncbi:hypothetical protein KKH82_03825, partial [Patescibacteria group bacterium]|nr:hypothetical protein [Patescibacteria group bacterium]
MDDKNKLEKNKIIYYDAKKILRKKSSWLHKLIRSINPDAIVCHFSSGSHFFVSILYHKCPVAAIAMGHDVLYDFGDSHIDLSKRLLIRMALRRSAYISAKSKFLEERIRRYGVKSKIRVNYWGSNLTSLKPKNKTESREKLGLPIKGPIILSPRAVEPRLNIHLIIEAMSRI